MKGHQLSIPQGATAGHESDPSKRSRQNTGCTEQIYGYEAGATFIIK